MRGRPPKVTCLCPTYGRFSKLRDSLSCFLHQTYPYKELLILNDAPVSFRCPFPNVTVVNKDDMYETLGYKRQAILEMADGQLVSHWDDDDLYLPWHLEKNVEKLRENDWGCVKPKYALMLVGSEGGPWRMKGPEENVFEAMITFRRKEALDLGGYSNKSSGQTLKLLNAFGGRYHVYKPEPFPSFIFRWNNGVRHIQGNNNENAAQQFADGNQDFGDGSLLPRDLSRYLLILDETLDSVPYNKSKLMGKLSIWKESPL